MTEWLKNYKEFKRKYADCRGVLDSNSFEWLWFSKQLEGYKELEFSNKLLLETTGLFPKVLKVSNPREYLGVYWYSTKLNGNNIHKVINKNTADYNKVLFKLMSEGIYSTIDLLERVYMRYSSNGFEYTCKKLEELGISHYDVMTAFGDGVMSSSCYMLLDSIFEGSLNVKYSISYQYLCTQWNIPIETINVSEVEQYKAIIKQEGVDFIIKGYNRLNSKELVDSCKLYFQMRSSLGAMYENVALNDFALKNVTAAVIWLKEEWMNKLWLEEQED